VFDQEAISLAKIGMENILQSWSCFAPGQGAKLDEYFNLLLAETNRRNTGLKNYWENIGALLGRKRKFLQTVYNPNWCAYFGAEDLGTDLVVTWDLYSKNPMKGQEKIGLFKSDFIEINSIKTFASVSQDCAVVAIERLFDEAGLDKKDINRKSSGALGPL
jgi:hypothetical protein